MKLTWRDSKYGPSWCDIAGLNVGVYPAGKGYWRLSTGIGGQGVSFKGTLDEAKLEAVKLTRTSLKKALDAIG